MQQKKTFLDYLLDGADKVIDDIEAKVRDEYKGKAESDELSRIILLEIAQRVMKKDTPIPNWIKSKAMDAYDKAKKSIS